MTLSMAAALLLAQPAAGTQEALREPYEDQINWGRRIERPDLRPGPLSLEGVDLARSCRLSRRRPPRRCTHYIAGAADRLVTDRVICPVTGSIVISDLVEAVRSYMRRQPEAARWNGSASVKTALEERYPCPR